jgi:RNA polymerase sigma-70 factor (ECF subfamily)
MKSSTNSITKLLIDWREGDKTALNKLFPLVYKEMRRLAHFYMQGERPGHMLQTSALINEAYLKLVGHKGIQWQNRAHFFGVAARAMRRILVDNARARNYGKRGAGAVHIGLDEANDVAQTRAADLIALDDALTALATLDPRKSHVVELRYFGGLSVVQTAEVLGISTATVMRDWDTAKAWLLRAMSPTDPSGRRAKTVKKKTTGRDKS